MKKFCFFTTIESYLCIYCSNVFDLERKHHRRCTGCGCVLYNYQSIKCQSCKIIMCEDCMVSDVLLKLSICFYKLEPKYQFQCFRKKAQEAAGYTIRSLHSEYTKLYYMSSDTIVLGSTLEENKFINDVLSIVVAIYEYHENVRCDATTNSILLKSHFYKKPRKYCLN